MQQLQFLMPGASGNRNTAQNNCQPWIRWDWPGTGHVVVEDIGISHVTLKYSKMAVDGPLTHAAEGIDCNCVKYVVDWQPPNSDIIVTNTKKIDKNNPKLKEVILWPATAVQCSVKADTGLPRELLEEYAQLVKAGEVGLFLDAICITSGHLLEIVQSLQPDVLHHVSLLPSSIELVAINPPYKFRLRFCHLECKVALGIQLFANAWARLTVDGLSGGTENEEGDASERNKVLMDGPSTDGYQGRNLQLFFKELLEIPVVRDSDDGQSVWCKAALLQKVIRMLLVRITH